MLLIRFKHKLGTKAEVVLNNGLIAEIKENQKLKIQLKHEWTTFKRRNLAMVLLRIEKSSQQILPQPESSTKVGKLP